MPGRLHDAAGVGGERIAGMFDRFQSEPYAMRRMPDFETEIICEKCRGPVAELRRMIESGL